MPSSSGGHQRRTRPALTIVELLVATALASMLIVAVLGILAILAEKRRVLIDESAFVPWHQRLEGQLRFDLGNARRFELAPDRLRLVGYGGRNFETGRPTHRRTEVVYRLATAADKVWLVRDESQLDSISNANRRTEIVCSGIGAIAMEVPGEHERKAERSGALPECFRLLLVGNAPSESIRVLYCN